jgi:TP901 family phage tail tape measure protein
MAKATDEYRIKFGIDGRDQLGKFKIELAQLNKQLADVLKKKAKHKGADAASAKQVGNLTKKIEKQKNAIKLQNSALDKNTQATKKNTTAKKKQNTSLVGSIRNFAKMAAAVTAAIAVVRRLTSFISSSVVAFAEFEKGVKSVTTLMSSEDTGLFSGDLYRGSISLSKDFGFTIKDVNKAMFNSVSAGIAGGNAVKFLNEASELAIAGVTTLKDATMGLTTVLNAYGMEASEASRVSDVLFTTQKFGVTTVAELSKSLGVVVPFAASSGISIEELGAAIATTTRSGLDAAKSVTALRAAISQMQKPASASRDLFVKYGIPIGAAQMKAVGFSETLRRLNEVYKESPRDIELMFGNVRGLTAIFSLAGENADTYNKVLEENQDVTLSAANKQKALEENVDSSAMAIDRLSTAYGGLKIAVGDSEFFKDAIDGTTDLLNVLSNENISKMSKAGSLMHKINILLVGDYLADAIQGDDTDENKLKEAAKIALKNQADTFMESQKQLEGFKDKTDSIRAKMLGKENNFTSDEISFMKSFLGAPELKGFNSSLDSYAKSYREHLAKMKVLDDADNLKISNEKDRRADLAQKYDAFELQSRENLSSQIKILNEIDLTDKESRADTDLSIIQAKIQRERNLLAAMTTFEIDNEALRIKIQGNLDKLETQAKKKSLQIRNTNTDAFNLEEAAITKKFQEDKTASALKQAKTRELTNKQFRIKNIQEEIAYQQELLELSGSTEATKEKIRAKIANLNVQLAKASFKEEEKVEKQKVDFILKGIELIAESRKKALEAELANRERAIEKEKEAVSQEFRDGLINQRQEAEQKEKLEKESFELRKKNEIKMAKISLQQELANIAVAAAANPGNPFTFGAAGAAQYTIQAALAIARHVANVSTIEAQKFAKGGMVFGNSHAQGGEKFAVGGRVVELEGGEAVINKRSTAMFGGALSAMNVAGGGTSFNSPNFGGSGLIDYEALGSVIGRNTNVVLPVESLNKTQKRVKMLESSSKF